MFVWIVWTLVTGITAFDGYSEVVDLFNHKWTDSCSLIPDQNDRSLSHPILNSIGPCSARLEVLQLPPKYQPNWLLNADCAQGCLRRNCSAVGSKPHSCQQVRRDIVVLDHEDRPQSFTISLGCLCSQIPNRYAEIRPPLVS